MLNFVEGLRQEAEMRKDEGLDVARLEELAYYIESLEHTIKKIEEAAWSSGAPLLAIDKILAPIKLQDKRMKEWMYGTWSPGPDGKRPMTGILELK
jgi:hypothetical protein